MKIFLIYSFSNKEEMKSFIVDKCEKHKNLQIIKLKSKFNFCWKICSKRQINMADFIIFIVGEHSHKSENIVWELKVAKKTGKKVYIAKLDEAFNLSSLADFGEVIAKDEIDTVIKMELNADNKKIEETLFKKIEPSILMADSETKKLLFEEYKLLLQTSESLIVRRQTMNTFFLTANGVLISMVGLIAGMKIENAYLCVFPCLALVGIFLCIAWRSLLVSYGQLNAGKFTVLNKLEQCLPVSIFSAEWIALGEGKNKKKYKSFTQSEIRVPFLFLISYIILVIATVIFNFNTIKNLIKCYIVN